MVPIALFDLDETLLAGDSDYLWGQHLVQKVQSTATSTNALIANSMSNTNKVRWILKNSHVLLFVP